MLIDACIYFEGTARHTLPGQRKAIAAYSVIRIGEVLPIQQQQVFAVAVRPRQLSQSQCEGGLRAPNYRLDRNRGLHAAQLQLRHASTGDNHLGIEWSAA
jgi:hypothetical protein